MSFCNFQSKRAQASQKKYDDKSRAERPRWYAGAMLKLLKASREGITVAWQRERDELIQEIEE